VRGELIKAVNAICTERPVGGQVRKLMDDALTSIESAVVIIRAVIIVTSIIGVVGLYGQRLVAGVMCRGWDCHSPSYAYVVDWFEYDECC